MSKTTAILIKENAMDLVSLRQYYLDPLAKNGIPEEDIIVLPVMYNTGNKIVAKTAKAYLDKLRARIPDTVDKLIIADGNYFKFITKQGKLADTYGTTVQGAYNEYSDFTCVYVPNYKSLFKQPENADLIRIGLDTISQQDNGFSINTAYYALEFNQDHCLYDLLYQYPALTMDIETTGLSLEDHVISVSFAWSKYDGVSIDLDINGYVHLKRFIESYQGVLIFHNALFDCKILVRQLWMDYPTDFTGMNEGLQYFSNVHDTMLLVYLEKNATTQVNLGLKQCALEYVGNYAIETENITKHRKADILRYNLIDALGTWYLWEKYQEHVESEPYTVIFRPSIPLLLKCMIVGLPLDNARVEEADTILRAKEKILTETIQSNSHVQGFTQVLRTEACEKKNKELKKLRKTVDDFAHVNFNPNSNIQLGKFLHDYLDLPVLDTTKTGAPKTDADCIKNLKHHTTDPEVISFLEAVQELADVTKINGTFIKAFKEEKDFLHGNLKLGGTQSGRLASNSPNLTNLPAHGPMGKLVKSCIKSPEGWLFCGADFSSLEERIGAILSKDPERIKVYTDGFDGHSMRTMKYFSDQMPDLVAKVEAAETATKFWYDEEKGEFHCE